MTDHQQDPPVICGAKPTWQPDAPGCGKLAGHDDQHHNGAGARWPNHPEPSPRLYGRAYVEDLERRAAERDVLAHDLETAQRLTADAAEHAKERDRDWQDQLDTAKEERSAWRTRADHHLLKVAELERDNQRLEQERDAATLALADEQRTNQRLSRECDGYARQVRELERVRGRQVQVIAKWRDTMRDALGTTLYAPPRTRCDADHPPGGPGVSCSRDAGHPDDHYNARYDVDWDAEPDATVVDAEPATCGDQGPHDVRCGRTASHDGDHEHTTADKGVAWINWDAETADAVVLCGLAVVFNNQVRTCDLPTGHDEPHRATGLEELTWR